MMHPEDHMLDLQCINTLRTLAIDQVQKANSGHPGTPMGAAPTAYCLWQRFLNFDPEDASWPDRDRFVLSVGHASALLYGLLHLCGVKATPGAASPASLDTTRDGLAVTMADLQSFRQAGSRCTGHPEYGWTTGVETTTGPLGQGVATSVGMAIAQAWAAATYNRPGFTLFEHRVFALAGDGDMMEGLSAEAASLAGHLKLGRLCWIYDSNHISIEGSTDLTFTENLGARFAACGWQVLQVADANDIEATALALKTFEATRDRPTLVIVHSHIGYGAPHKQDSAAAHGEPLGVDESRAAKQFYGFDPDASFAVPDGVREHFGAHFGLRGAGAHGSWRERFAAYRVQYPDLAVQIDQMQRRELLDAWDTVLPAFERDAKGLATRDASGQVLNAIATRVPWLLGGAADLAPSTKTTLAFDFAGAFEPPSPAGRNFHFGIREHAMCAVATGMALSGLRPYAASFFVFTDYCRGAIRLAAMMGLPVICVWTHELDRRQYAEAQGLARGAYVLADAADGLPDVLLLASGSEVALCITAYEQLKLEGVRARVISMPSWDLFERQEEAYREHVLPAAVTARVSVEAAAALGWDRYAGQHGAIIAMRSYGLSAPGKVAQAHFGFDVAHVLAAARQQLARRDRGIES